MAYKLVSPMTSVDMHDLMTMMSTSPVESHRWQFGIICVATPVFRDKCVGELPTLFTFGRSNGHANSRKITRLLIGPGKILG